MGAEEDPVFNEGAMRVPDRGDPEADAAERRAYRAMSVEDRRAAWDAVRLAQTRRARRSGRIPLFLALASVAAILGGVWLVRHDAPTMGGVLLWSSIALAGFAVIAFTKSLLHGLPWEDTEIPPPPGM